MIDGLKPYGEYKESGVTWLGKLPAHWSIGPGFAAFRENQTKNKGLIENQVLSLSYGKIIIKSMDKLHGLVPDNFETYQIVEPGDIIIRPTDLQNDKTSLRVGLVRDRGIITSAYICLKTVGKMSSAFGHQLLLALDLMKVYYGMGSGLRQNLSFLDFKRLPIFVPPPDEQAAIVRFLDHANQRIDRFIRTKKKVIALLNEQKQAIIHRAVTRGIDPNVKLKDSGIPWLGEIPEHWEVISLRMRYSVELGKMLDAKRVTGRNSVPYLRNRDVQWDRINSEDLPHMDIAEKEYSRYTVQSGDLLVCEGGQVGRAAFWKNPIAICGYQKALHRVRALNINKDCPRFFYFLLNLAATKGVFTADGNENTIAHLTCEKLRRHRFVFPSYKEQKNIADGLDSTLMQFQKIIQRTEREISIIREYRTRLIADVVTGKIDVREAARNLPATSLEPDAEDLDEESELEPEPTEAAA